MKKTLLLLLSIVCLAACRREAVPEGNFTDVRHPAWAQKAVIYQINVRQFSPEGTSPPWSRSSTVSPTWAWISSG